MFFNIDNIILTDQQREFRVINYLGKNKLLIPHTHFAERCACICDKGEVLLADRSLRSTVKMI